MRYIVIVTTLNRFYKFHEVLKVEDKSPFLQVGFKYIMFYKFLCRFLQFFCCNSFQHVFNSYLNVPEDIKDFHEIPKKLKYSQLRFSYDKTTKFPKFFGWLTEPGIFAGEVSFDKL